MCPGLQLANALDVDDARVVNAHEDIGVQLIGEGLHRLPQQVNAPPDIQPRVVSVSGDPVDLCGANDGHLTRGFDRDPVGRFWPRGRGICQLDERAQSRPRLLERARVSDPLPNAAHRFLKPRSMEWLE